VFGLVKGFTGPLKLVTTGNYNRFTNSHTLQFMRVKNSSQSLLIMGCSLVTASNILHFLASIISGFCPRWVAPVSQLNPHGGNSCPLTTSSVWPPLDTAGYHSLPPGLRTTNLSLLDWQFCRVRLTLIVSVHRQSVHIGAKPLEDHDQIFFFASKPLRP
jgi:hypothetical protein